MTNFKVALFGNDINTYSVARAFYEEYGIRSDVFCKTEYGPCGNSIICNLTVHPEIDLAPVFLPKVLEYRSKRQDKKVLLVGGGDK